MTLTLNVPVYNYRKYMFFAQWIFKIYLGKFVDIFKQKIRNDLLLNYFHIILLINLFKVVYRNILDEVLFLCYYVYR